MPMAFFNENDVLRARQSFDSPTVYFDHWALCEFSDNKALQDRFVNAMLEKQGTFVLSNINIVEFTNSSDPRHTIAAETFLERLMPNIFLADFDLDQVEQFERNPANANQRMWLPADLPMLKFVAEHSLKANSKLSLIGFIRMAYLHREQLSEVFSESNNNILDMLNKQRCDTSYTKKARNSVPDIIRPKSHVVMGELMRELTIDPNAKITVNDIADWQHAVLPISYCDYVLLDGKWEQRAIAMNIRMKKQGLTFKLAKCFSKRNSGLNRFLTELEAH